MTRDPIRIVLIEDSRLACDLVATMLGAQPNFKVVATAASVTTGLAHVQETKPHVVLVDAGLGKYDCHLCLKNAKNMAPEARVILMDVRPVQEDIIALIKAGANGFILKHATLDDFVGTIRSVSQGTDVIPAFITPTLLSYIADQSIVRTPPGVPPAAARMTKRERGIVALIVEGLSNKEIAQRLNIATYTVKSHVHNIMGKLALHTRLQIAVHARSAGAPTDSMDLGIVEVDGEDGQVMMPWHAAC